MLSVLQIVHSFFKNLNLAEYFRNAIIWLEKKIHVKIVRRNILRCLVLNSYNDEILAIF